MPGNEVLAKLIVARLESEAGIAEIHSFPDGETYVRLLSDVKNKEMVLVCSLHQPDQKFLPLYFLAKRGREAGAEKITLVAPYLAYMRQDKQFHPGEAVTSSFFAEALSGFLDELVTIDPHLHRIHAMSDIYSIPCQVLHVSHEFAGYIREKFPKALLVGPDAESRQWVSAIAGEAGVPYLILEKTRLGDREVAVSLPDVKEYAGYIPVLIDDIASTARTLVESVIHLSGAGMNSPVCMIIHPVFSGNAFEELRASGASEIISCNTIPHPSNKIDISGLLADAIRDHS